ncbi:hypothetical protein SeMB42_g03435 [Synchytrium endobioticum]|uniref:tRNA-splicing endonuclease subunit Sen2 n=1 Tax=Synchytrium endobioticum TaxID=286115 RepID=A0A507D735_9FUNG|nr:hypothetical protein SeLEV6574_g04072 [Synchytrium endobioticum]TPX47137.1 hypothetical protein SeMB42_g03435 [Synchytrium endobioticum]
MADSRPPPSTSDPVQLKRKAKREALNALHANPLPIRPSKNKLDSGSWPWSSLLFLPFTARTIQDSNANIKATIVGIGVWIDDFDQSRILWTDGFFGKGTLSRSEPLYGRGNENRMGILKRKLAGKLGNASVSVAVEAAGEGEKALGYNPERVQLSPFESIFLAWALDCVDIRSACGEPMGTTSLWKYMMNQMTQYTTQPDVMTNGLRQSEWEFIARYIVYHVYRARRWVVWSGIKFGADFVCYRKGPVFTHSEYALVVLPVVNNETVGFSQDFKWYLGLNRVCAQVKKNVVLCYVHFGDDFTVRDGQHPYDVLRKYRLEEITIKRFIPERNRD